MSTQPMMDDRIMEAKAMDSSMERSADGWEVTHRAEVSYDGVALPPAILPRVATLAAVPAGTHVLATEADGQVLERLIAAIGAAQRMVVAGAFLFSAPELERAMMAAAKRGVRVYLLVASEQRLLTEPRADSEFDQRMFAEHQQLLDRLAGWVYIRTAEDWHAKAVLIDDGDAGAGFLLTANLTIEALTRNEELMVILGAEERAELREVVRWALWRGAQHEVLVPGKLDAVTADSSVELPNPRGALVATLRERGTLHDAMLDVIASARRELIVSSFGWEATHPVVMALCEQARTGCRVTVLARERAASMPALLALRGAGAQVLLFRWLHAKAIWSDDGRAIVASANLESQGLDRGIEIGVRLQGGPAQELSEVLRAWAARAQGELRVDARLGDVGERVRLWRGGKLEPVEVPTTMELPHERHTADTAADLSAPPILTADDSRLPQPLAHTHLVTRIVAAPTLDKGAKRIDEGDETWPARFRERSGRVVVAVTAVEQLEAAQAMAVESGGAPVVVARSKA